MKNNPIDVLNELIDSEIASRRRVLYLAECKRAEAYFYSGAKYRREADAAVVLAKQQLKEIESVKRILYIDYKGN